MKNLKVYIYFNLNKNLFSIKINGRVMANAKSLLVKNAIFRVSQKGRERVIRTGVRNVHAGVIGDLVINPQDFPKEMPNQVVRYNPFRSDQFLKDNQPIKEANLVYFNQGKCFI